MDDKFVEQIFGPAVGQEDLIVGPKIIPFFLLQEIFLDPENGLFFDKMRVLLEQLEALREVDEFAHKFLPLRVVKLLIVGYN